MDLNSLKAALRDAPPRDAQRMTKKAVIAALFDEINVKLHHEKWRIGDIVYWLRQKKIEISERTLRVYLHELRAAARGATQEDVEVRARSSPPLPPTIRRMPSAMSNQTPAQPRFVPPATTSAPGKFAPTLAYLEQHASEVSAALREDVIVVDGEHVCYASGAPLDVALSIRQLRLLKVSGRLVAGANGESRTAKKFVKLPDKY